MNLLMLAAAIVLAWTLPANARRYYHYPQQHWQQPHHWHGGWPEQRTYKRKHKHKRKALRAKKPRHAHHRRHHVAKIADLVEPLKVKVQEIIDNCGSQLISAHRHGARIPGGRLSLHAHYPARAADLQGNPSCIRAALKGWPGGMSTDYARVRHYHISYHPGGHEWGRRFAHRTGTARRVRIYATAIAQPQW